MKELLYWVGVLSSKERIRRGTPLLGKTKVTPLTGVEMGETGRKSNSSNCQILPILGPQFPLGLNLRNTTHLTLPGRQKEKTVLGWIK